MSEESRLYEELKKSHGIFSIHDDNLPDFVDLAKDFAFYKGICARKEKLPHDSRSFVSFCLLPSPFQENWFNLAKTVQRDLNYVIHRVAHDGIFLKNCLEKTIESDDFIAKIWNIFEITQKEGIAQPICLGLLRSDYMLSTDGKGVVTGIKQVENNTISVSFSGLASNTTNLHRFVLDRIGRPDLAVKLPDNPVTYDVAKGLIAAWNAYNLKSAIILFVLEEVVSNICDMRALEFAIFELNKEVQIRRYTFSALRHCTKLENKKLFVEGREVGLVYYRTGYVPDQYEAEDWDLRLLMERSMAIKCPTVGYHLAGTKRVQLQLSRPGVLERFLPKDSDPELFRSTFVEFYTFDMGTEGDKAVGLAIHDYDRFVMKPEREGGGNNVYGENIKALLECIGHHEKRESYILMEKINPPTVMNAAVRADKLCKFTKMISELGVYGVILGTRDEVNENYEAGHFMKTKPVDTDEGGIAAGFSSLDNPYLIQSQSSL